MLEPWSNFKGAAFNLTSSSCILAGLGLRVHCEATIPTPDCLQTSHSGRKIKTIICFKSLFWVAFTYRWTQYTDKGEILFTKNMMLLTFNLGSATGLLCMKHSLPFLLWLTDGLCTITMSIFKFYVVCCPNPAVLFGMCNLFQSPVPGHVWGWEKESWWRVWTK